MTESAKLSPVETPFTRKVDAHALDFIRRFEKLPLNELRNYEVVRQGESLLVGISGGPDSTALLIILRRLRDELGLRITAAHFDHMLRSREEADGDRAFVESLCRRLRVPLTVGRGNVRIRARRHGESIEEAARNLRYRYFGRLARAGKISGVAVGHTLDDRAETLLLHVIRGSSIEGLAAMPPRALWPFGRGPDLVRPLLDLRRSDTERYCRESGVEPRIDSTNELTIATRNRIRKELVPLLRSFNPRVDESLARLADAAVRDAAFIEQFVDAGWRLYASRGAGGVKLKRTYLERLDIASTSRSLRRAAAVASANKVDLEWEHVEQVLRSLAKPRARTTLPGGLVATTDANFVTIGPGATRNAKSLPPQTLRNPGRTRAGDWTIEALRVERDAIKPRDPFAALFDVDAVDGPLIVRSRKPGDRMRPLGLGGSKKLQDILVDAKVPAEERDAVPVIADRHGIVWVAGHCIDERVAVAQKTRRVMRIRARRKPSR